MNLFSDHLTGPREADLGGGKSLAHGVLCWERLLELGHDGRKLRSALAASITPDSNYASLFPQPSYGGTHFTACCDLDISSVACVNQPSWQNIKPLENAEVEGPGQPEKYFKVISDLQGFRTGKAEKRYKTMCVYVCVCGKCSQFWN